MKDGVFYVCNTSIVLGYALENLCTGHWVVYYDYESMTMTMNRNL